MKISAGHLCHLTDRDRDHLETVVEQFEAAWEREEHPFLDAFLPPDGDLRHALAVELALADLEYRRRAGEPASADDYLNRYPEIRDASGAESELREAERRWINLPPVADRGLDNSRPTIPGYELLGELGRGGMGVVYKARQIAADRVVALKMIRIDGSGDADLVARFRTEAEAAARLQHPNIVQIFEVGEHDRRPYFAMEFVEGGTLADHLAAGPLSPADAAALLLPIARAVAAAHARGVLHRDLKPANILLESRERQRPEPATLEKAPVTDAPGSPKVADFGLAKRLDRASDQTRTGAVIGTPSFMAPEQAAGPSRDLTTAADIYALGATLYACLTGRPPFQSATVLETIEQVRSNEPVAPRLLQPGVPRDLQTICLKCLAKEPAKRYATAAELADDLGRFQAGKPVRARRVTSPERLWRWCRRNPVIAALTATLALFLPAALVTVSILYWQEEHQRISAQTAALQSAADAARADEKSEQARATVDQMLSALGSKLFNTTDIPKVRRDMYQRALSLYERFAVEPGGDAPAIRLGLGKTYARLGSIDRDLGRLTESRDELGRAEAILSVLAAERPDDPVAAREMSFVLGTLAGLLRKTGDRPGAVAAYRRVADDAGRRARASAGDPVLSDRHTTALSNLAVALKENAQSAEAIDTLRECVAQFRRRLAAEPATLGVKAGLANCLTNLAILLDEAGQTTAAEESIREAVDAYEALFRAAPAQVNYREWLANAATNRGAVLGHLDRWTEAAAAFRRARDIRMTLARDFPDLPAHRLQMAQAHSNLAVALNDGGRPDEAAREIAAAFPLLEGLIADFPVSLDFQTQLASAYTQRGSIALAAARPTEALADFGRTATLIEKHADEWLNVPANRRLLAVAYRSRGSALGALGRQAEAVAEFARALTYFLPGQRWPTQVLRAKAIARAADPSAAAQAADELARATNPTAAQLRDLAEVYAVIAGEIKHDPDRAESYAAQAVHWLGAAKAAGDFRDARHAKQLQSNPDFDVLRSRADFRKLLP